MNCQKCKNSTSGYCDEHLKEVMPKMLQIIKGLDGSYVVKGNKLIKIIKAVPSEDYYLTTGGYVEYELEDGTTFITE
jgi:hypothetical protein